MHLWHWISRCPLLVQSFCFAFPGFNTGRTVPQLIHCVDRGYISGACCWRYSLEVERDRMPVHVEKHRCTGSIQPAEELKLPDSRVQRAAKNALYVFEKAISDSTRLVSVLHFW